MNRIEIVGFAKALQALTRHGHHKDVEEILEAVLDEAQLAKKEKSKEPQNKED